MRTTLAPLFLAAALTGAAGAQSLTIISAAGPNVGIAPDSLASIFGGSISTQMLSASAPWPTQLGDIPGVNVKDSTGQTSQAGILFISQSQMNIYIPPQVAPGPAVITFPFTGLPPGVGTAALRSVGVNILKVGPGLFSASGTGSGVAAATAVRVVIPTQTQSAVPVFLCNSPGNCAPVPIALGVDTPIYVSLFGTGIRNATSVMVTVGNTTVAPTYAGPQGQYPGVDQVNFPLSLNLRSAGVVNVTVTADGVTSNAVQLSIQ